MTDLERAREILAGYPLETAQHVIAEALAAGRREGEEKMREAAAQECVRHAKFCKDEAHKGGDWAHLITRADEATYNAQRIRALPLTPEETP